MKNFWKTGLWLAGLALFSFAVAQIGVDRLIREMEALKVGLMAIVALSLVRLFLQTRSWATALRQDGIRPTTSELMFLRLASQGIGYLTILGPAASEPMKIKLLQHHRGSATAATLVDTGVYWVSAAFVLVAGLVSATLIFTHSQRASLLLASIVTAGIVVLVQPKLILSRLVLFLSRHAPRWLTKAAQIETEIRTFARLHPAAIRQMLLLDLACQVLLLAEVATVLYFLHLPIRGGAILSIEAAGRAVRMIGGWLPARIGADESGAAAAFAGLGMPAAAGLALALARRVRDMLNSLVGLLWLAWRARTDPNIADRTRVPSPMLSGALSCKL